MRTIITFAAVSIALFFNPVWATTMTYSDLAHRISDETAKTIESKYKMSCIGSGGGMMDGVGHLSLSFELAPPITVASARKLIVETAEIYLSNINSNKVLRPYLGEYPFRDIALRFFVKNPEKYSTAETLSTFTLWFNEKTKQTIVRYSICDKNGFSKLLVDETYEEAKKLAPRNEAVPTPASSSVGISCGPIDQTQSGPMVQRNADKVMRTFAEGYAAERSMKFINIGAPIETYSASAFALWMADFSPKTVDEGRVAALNFLQAFWAEIQKNPKLIAWFEEECASNPRRYQKPLDLQWVMFRMDFWDKDVNRPKAPYLSKIVFYKNTFYYYVADPKTDELQLLQTESYDQSVSKSKEKLPPRE